MVETFFIDDDADVTQVAKEYKRSKLELLALWWGFKRGPVRARGTSLKVDANILERPPN